MLLALCILSAIVWRLQPARTVNGVPRLVRVSDLNPLREAQDDLFNKLHPEAHIDLDPAGGVEKVIVQCMGGVGPDLFDCSSPFDLSAYVQAGIAWDITDELKARGIDLPKLVYPSTLATSVVDGRVYGVPTNIAADGLWFHRDLLAAAGIPEHKGPWRWSEFIPIAQKLTERDVNGRATRFGFSFEWWQWMDFFKGFGARVYSRDGTRCILGSRESVEAVQLMHDLIYKYKVSSSPVEEASMATMGGFGSGSMTVFGAKRAAFALGGRWWLATLRTYPGLSLGVAESPYGTAHKFYSYGRATLINKNSPYRALALEYLLFQLGPQYNRLINAQADSISAIPAFNETSSFLHDPNHPEEAYNLVWRTVVENSEAAEASPFVSGATTTRIINEQLDLVKTNQKSPQQAMDTAAREVNAEIARTLREDPRLMARYRQIATTP